jgi:hypothetical protein
MFANECWLAQMLNVQNLVLDWNEYAAREKTEPNVIRIDRILAFDALQLPAWVLDRLQAEPPQTPPLSEDFH